MADASFAVTTYIFFHKTAHMLIDIYNLLVLGPEEDAADFLSVIMMIHLTDERYNLPLYTSYGSIT